jgi:anti-anti-sigma factor
MSAVSAVARLQVRTLDDRTLAGFVRGPVLRGPETAHVVRQTLRALERHRRPVVLLDLADVDALTAAALGRLVVLYRRLRRDGGRLVLANVSPLLHEVFAVTRLDTLFEVRGAGQGTEAPCPVPA